MTNVGILYPRSGIYPLLGSDLLEGIRAFLSTQGITDPKFTLAQVGFGENEKEVYQQVEKLLTYEKVDLDHKLARVLDPLFLATDRLFIVVNPGANYPHNWVPPRTTIYVSLQNSFLSYLTGRMAVEEGDQQGALAVSYYDGGYLHCSSMVEGFMEGGGQIRFNHICSPSPQDFTIEPLIQQIRALDLNACLTLFSDGEALKFLKHFHAADLPTEANIYVSPMMFDEQLAGEETSTSSFQGYIPWHSGIDSEANRFFQATIQKVSSREPNLFSLLGWEAGMLLAALSRFNEKKGKNQVEELKKLEFESPRGKALIDPDTQFLLAPIYKAINIKGKISLEQRNGDEMWRQFTRMAKDLRASGWNNTYLCY